MCSVCGDTGYMPAVRYGVGYGTSDATTLWADHVVIVPCRCQMWRWPHAPEPIIIPIPDKS